MNQFKKYRLIKGCTQAEIAKAIGISTVAYSKWENGLMFPSAKRLKKVAKVLDTTVERLLEEKEVS